MKVSSSDRRERQIEGLGRDQRERLEPDPRVLLARKLGNAAMARLAGHVVSRRYDKPRPGESEHEGIALKEHHVVDYKKIAAFGESIKDDFGMEARRVAFRPLFSAWETVTIDELLNVRQLRQTELFEPHRAELARDMLENLRTTARQAPRVVTIGAAGAATNEPNLGSHDAAMLADLDKAEKAYRDLTNPGQSGDDVEVDQTLVMDYWVWNHTNLFVGPAERVWDPGDSFDFYAQYFMDPVRYERLVSLNKLIDDYKEAGELSERKKILKHIRLVISRLARDNNQRIEFEDTKDGWTQVNEKWKPHGAPDKGPPK